MKQKTKYTLRAGSRLTIDPQVCGEYIEAIRLANDGRITPYMLVANAADPASPLHKAFEWDDGEAAHRYRIDQARTVLQVIVTITPSESNTPIVTQAFVHIAEPEHYYTSQIVAMSDDDLRRQVIEQAKAGAASWAKRYKDLRSCAELEPVFTAIEKVSRRKRSRRKAVLA